MTRFIPFLAVAFLTVNLSCGDNPTAPKADRVASVVASHATLVIEPGGSTELRAERRNADGLTLGPGGIQWEALDPSVADITPAGLVRAHTPGNGRKIGRASCRERG